MLFLTCNIRRVRESPQQFKQITPERNVLADDIIEVGERLKAWWDQGFIRGQYGV
jgi:hypothetical protein